MEEIIEQRYTAMHGTETQGYSRYIRLFNITFDLLIINLIFPFVFAGQNLNNSHFGMYINVCWGGIAYFSGFYEVYRYTGIVQVISKLVRQGVLFVLVSIAFFPFAKNTTFVAENLITYTASVLGLVTLFKIGLFYYLKQYRIATGSNYRNVIIIGHSQQAVKLKDFFETSKDFGYHFKGFFSDRKGQQGITGGTAAVKQYVLDNSIDEVYCSLSEVTDRQLKNLVEFADDNNVTIKFIPDTREIFSKNLRIDHYEMFPVLSLRKTALHEPSAQIVKRLFDIAFSLTVFILLLSWLTPLMALLIKLESRGPVFFKQSRPGLNEKEFFCWKFRSMQINETTEKSVTKNDPRVTRVGKFIRKTSIDELPQFLNVLRGEMSIVGPRPHLWTQNNLYGQRIKKYMVRLYVKPGITGLAQVRGCRGEIATDVDMINRIKYDVFYIENWSMLLDFKIIVQTVVNIFMGEEKAY
ncbi:undecaprenyl-phosphate glucose phosphotransferase [Flavobacterium sp. RHBU_3]|uniref:undecaprenyl-phosphate glucose phosphotransferase n=1 Tax=Flavobacterium sp. RHBU_3 TaxID=3391184 RepID=UPI003984F867